MVLQGSLHRIRTKRKVEEKTKKETKSYRRRCSSFATSSKSSIVSCLQYVFAVFVLTTVDKLLDVLYSQLVLQFEVLRLGAQ